MTSLVAVVVGECLDRCSVEQSAVPMGRGFDSRRCNIQLSTFIRVSIKQRGDIMGHKAYSKAWREELIRANSKARVVVHGVFAEDKHGNQIHLNAMDRQVKRLLG